MIECLAELLIVWLIEKLIQWLIECLIELFPETLIHRLSECFIELLAEWARGLERHAQRSTILMIWNISFRNHIWIHIVPTYLRNAFQHFLESQSCGPSAGDGAISQNNEIHYVRKVKIVKSLESHFDFLRS